jgi:hypothetical protein
MGLTKRNQKKFTKRNEILPLTKRSETKFRCFLFRETSEISRNKFFVSHSFVFRETEKRKRNGNPYGITNWGFCGKIINTQIVNSYVIGVWEVFVKSIRNMWIAHAQ